MNLSEMTRDNWVVLSCSACERREYVYNKLQTTQICPCGNSDMELVLLKDWTSGDFVHICHEYLIKHGLEDLSTLPDELYEGLKEEVEDENLLRKLIVIVTDQISDYLCK